MDSYLTDFMVNLGEDPSSLAAFRENPSAVMAEAGLSDEDVAAILSKRGENINRAAARHNSKLDIATDINVVVVITPITL